MSGKEQERWYDDNPKRGSSISNSYSVGNIAARSQVGGLVGFSGGLVAYSYHAYEEKDSSHNPLSGGKVRGAEKVGGLIGQVERFYSEAVLYSFSGADVQGIDELTTAGLIGTTNNQSGVYGGWHTSNHCLNRDFGSDTRVYYDCNSACYYLSGQATSTADDDGDPDTANACDYTRSLDRADNSMGTVRSIENLSSVDCSSYKFDCMNTWDKTPLTELPKLNRTPISVSGISGSGTRDLPFLINSIDDWNTVNNRREFSSFHFRLENVLNFDGIDF